MTYNSKSTTPSAPQPLQPKISVRSIPTALSRDHPREGDNEHPASETYIYLRPSGISGKLRTRIRNKGRYWRIRTRRGMGHKECLVLGAVGIAEGSRSKECLLLYFHEVFGGMEGTTTVHFGFSLKDLHFPLLENNFSVSVPGDLIIQH